MIESNFSELSVTTDISINWITVSFAVFAVYKRQVFKSPNKSIENSILFSRYLCKIKIKNVKVKSFVRALKKSTFCFSLIKFYSCPKNV